METQGNDYKYIMEGLTEIAVGTRYTYAELEDNPELSYKFRCIIKRFFEQEVGRETSLESHLYYMKPEDESCRIYAQIKAKIRVYCPVTGKSFGRTKTIYKEQILKADEQSMACRSSAGNRGTHKRVLISVFKSCHPAVFPAAASSCILVVAIKRSGCYTTKQEHMFCFCSFRKERIY